VNDQPFCKPEEGSGLGITYSSVARHMTGPSPGFHRGGPNLPSRFFASLIFQRRASIQTVALEVNFWRPIFPSRNELSLYHKRLSNRVTCRPSGLFKKFNVQGSVQTKVQR